MRRLPQSQQVSFSYRLKGDQALCGSMSALGNPNGKGDRFLVPRLGQVSLLTWWVAGTEPRLPDRP